MPNVVCAQWSSPTPVFVLYDELGNPVSWTGLSGKFVVKRFITDPDSAILISVAITPDLDQVNNPGKYSIPLTSALTQIAPGNYPAELLVYNGATSTPPIRTESSTFSTYQPVLSQNV
jgi:hypothetical protein